jgi:6-phosphogluconolactonase
MPTNRRAHLLSVAAVLACSVTVTVLAQDKRASKPNAVRVYVGTYTDAGSKGIYRLRLDLATGALSPEGEPTPAVNPSFLALHPSRRFLYAVSEVGGKPEESGAVSAFAVDAQTGSLTLLNQQPSGGAGPCHISLDTAGRNLLVANYGGGTVAALPIGTDGRLGPPASVIRHQGQSVNASRQKAPHAHFIAVDAANRHALAADLGLDKVLVYRFDASKGTLVPNDPPAAVLAPGAGPRHLAQHPNGRRVYVANELLSTVTVFDYDAARGSLTEKQTLSSLPADFKGTSYPAEIVVSPDGRFLYISNRGHDSIGIFRIDGTSGQLTLVGHEPTQGNWPRNFAIDPTGAFLLVANQRADNVVVFRIDAASGRLAPVGTSVRISHPACVRMTTLSD